MDEPVDVQQDQDLLDGGGSGEATERESKRHHVENDEVAQAHREMSTLREAATAAGFPEPMEAIAAAQRLSNQVAELRRRETALVLRLSAREQELHEAHAAIAELRAAALPRRSQGRAALLDPAVNHAYQRLKRTAAETDERLSATRTELDAVKFDPQSLIGKQLMARVRALLQENEELARTVGEARVQKLEAELAQTRDYSAEIELNLKESNEFVAALDAEVEALQQTLTATRRQAAVAGSAPAAAGGGAASVPAAAVAAGKS
jgi:hypothetical protein